MLLKADMRSQQIVKIDPTHLSAEEADVLGRFLVANDSTHYFPAGITSQS